MVSVKVRESEHVSFHLFCKVLDDEVFAKLAAASRTQMASLSVFTRQLIKGPQRPRDLG